MPIVINPSASAGRRARASTAPVVLQPGSVVSARVLQVLGNDTVQIAIGGQSIDVLSQVPLQAGQTLQLAVSQTADSIRLAVVTPQGGAPASQGPTGAGGATRDDRYRDAGARSCRQHRAANDARPVAPQVQLTPPEALAVSVAAQTAATQQTSLAHVVCQSGRRRRARQPAAAGPAGGGAGAGAARRASIKT